MYTVDLAPLAGSVTTVQSFWWQNPGSASLADIVVDDVRLIP